MGKMKMGHDPRSKTKLGQGLIKAMKEVVQAEQAPAIDMKDIEAKLQEMIDSKVLSAPVEIPAAPLATMRPCCNCKPKMYKDKLARKHTILLKNMVVQDREELDNLLGTYVESCNNRLNSLEADMGATLINVDALLDEKPQEIQVVKEIIVEKAVTDPKVWIAIGVAILLNIGFILLK